MPTVDLYDRLLTDFAALTIAMNLQGDGELVADIGENVFAQTRNVGALVLDVFPCILWSREGLEEEQEKSSFTTDFVSYPCGMYIYDQSDIVNPNLAAPTYGGWRDEIQEALRGLCVPPLLPTCPELYDVRVRNLPSIPRGVPSPERIVSSLLAICQTARPRVRNS